MDDAYRVRKRAKHKARRAAQKVLQTGGSQADAAKAARRKVRHVARAAQAQR